MHKTEPQVDLRSDTVTLPTAAMKQAMLAAPLGDDVFADDPSVNALQDHAAELLGFEAALFAPSGTQTNLIALWGHCQRGDEAIVGQSWHTYRWEAGGMAVLGSIQPQPVETQPDGTLRTADIAAAIKPDDPHFARTRLVVLENTTGGQVLPPAYIAEVAQLARGREFEAFDRSLDVQISRLRKMIEADPSAPRHIQTVWGVGYVFVPDGSKHAGKD